MKLIQGKVIYIFIAVGLFFMLLGSLTVHLIDSKLQRFNTQRLKRASQEKYFLVNKELETIQHSLVFLSKIIDRQDTLVLKSLLENEDLYGFIAGYSYKKNNTTKYFIKPNYTKTKFVNKNNVAINNERVFLPSTFSFNGQDIFTTRKFANVDSSINFLINLNELNSRFWNEFYGGYAYVEIFDENGVLLIGPELSEVGKVKNIGKENLKDSVQLSDYIKLEVLVQSFDIKSFLSDNKMLISVPLIMQSADISEISNLIWLLWLLGILAALIFIFYVVTQNRKQHHLEMKNISYQNEKSMSELSNLKQKINPHFLFNTLGTLQYLVVKDADLAKTFVVKLAKVYRTLLNVPNTGVSSLKEEIELLKEYLFLQQLRFGQALKPVVFDVKEDMLLAKLPTLSLQILVENAIKHNQLTTENPLSIEIVAQTNGLIVKNNKKLRNGGVESEGYGTAIINKTYQFYKVAGYTVTETETEYVVYLPFIKN